MQKAVKRRVFGKALRNAGIIMLAINAFSELSALAGDRFSTVSSLLRFGYSGLPLVLATLLLLNILTIAGAVCLMVYNRKLRAMS